MIPVCGDVMVTDGNDGSAAANAGALEPGPAATSAAASIATTAAVTTVRARRPVSPVLNTGGV
jgi:hypothetical protein